MASAEDDTVRAIMLHLAAADVDACRATCRAWRKLGSEEHLWRRLAADAFWPCGGDAPPEQPLAPLGDAQAGSAEGERAFAPSSVVEPALSWRAAFRCWRALSLYVDGGGATDAPLWMRISRAWAQIEGALRERAPTIESTLCRPTSPARLAQIRSRTLRYIYAVHDGQHLAIDRFMLAHDEEGVRDSIDSLWHGLFGGYSAYRHNVCMRMHPTTIAADFVAQLGSGLFELSGAERARAAERTGADAHAASDHRLELLSTSYGFNRCFAVDVLGGIYCRGKSGAWEAAGPSAASWFCEYARRLSSGFYRVGQVYGPLPGEGIVLFQDTVDGEWCTRAVTHGVEVVASALYTPEHPQAFAYSLRMRMRDDAPHACAQLFQRAWTIADGSVEPPRRVVGEGVVGMFPVLRRGGSYRNDEQVRNLAGRPFEEAVPPGSEQQGWFVYQSFSGAMSSPDGGHFGGEIQFFPGTVTQPEGPPFNVVVAPFRLAKPEFVF